MTIPPCADRSLPAAWRAAALRITPGFESTGDPYRAVEGSFDGMGLSCGVLQWNLGQGSLQPLIRAVGKDHVCTAMPNHGARLWAACQSGNGSAVRALAKAWHKARRLDPLVRKELAALMSTPAMRAQQDKAIDAVAQAAAGQADAWARAAGRGAASLHEFAWFFDLVTQNGSLKGVTFGDVGAMIAAHGKTGAPAYICNELAAMAGATGHAADARRNGALWREATSEIARELLVASWLRAGKARAEWRAVVLNRKGTIAMGKGWVNSGRFDLLALLAG